MSDREFQVISTVTVTAKDAKEAALKAFALHEDMTPEEYLIIDPDAVAEEITLDQGDKEEARRANAAGEYFKQVRI